MSDLTSAIRRIIFGDNPPLFWIEVTFRTIVMFAATLLLLRWMGKRGLSQLSPFEFVIIIALGTAVGDPMLLEDTALFPAILVITTIVVLQQLMGRLTQNHNVIEQFVESRSELLVQCGRIEIEQLVKEKISQNELFEMMRLEGFEHLGQVRQAFLEPSGKLSVIRWIPSRPGLSLLPIYSDDKHFIETYDHRWICCRQCGTIETSSMNLNFSCSHCKSKEFKIACRDQPEGNEDDMK